MFYLIRSKGGQHSMRDGVEPDSPMYKLSCTEFTPFSVLPKGTSATGDGDVEVKEVESLEGQDFAKPVLAEGSAKPKKTQSELAQEKDDAELAKMEAEEKAAKKAKAKGK